MAECRCFCGLMSAREVSLVGHTRGFVATNIIGCSLLGMMCVCALFAFVLLFRMAVKKLGLWFSSYLV